MLLTQLNSKLKVWILRSKCNLWRIKNIKRKSYRKYILSTTNVDKYISVLKMIYKKTYKDNKEEQTRKPMNQHMEKDKESYKIYQKLNPVNRI